MGYWLLTLGTLTLLVAVLAAVTVDGIYQVSSGRPSLWPLGRILRKRIPATEIDCVREGASKILQVLAVACITAPGAVLGIQSAAILSGVIPEQGPHAPPPQILDVLMAVGLFGPLLIGLFLAIAAYTTNMRVKYVPIERQVRAA